MALYCSRDIFAALDGLGFPATKEELIEFAERKDAMEAVVVVLNQLKDDVIYQDVSEVCENARIACNYEVMKVMAQATFPAKRDGLLAFADRQNASAPVKEAIAALPSEYTFNSLDDICEHING